MRLRKEFQITAGCPHHRGLVECRIDSRHLTLWLSLCQLTYHRTANHRAFPHALVHSEPQIRFLRVPTCHSVFFSAPDPEGGKATIKTHVYVF